MTTWSTTRGGPRGTGDPARTAGPHPRGARRSVHRAPGRSSSRCTRSRRTQSRRSGARARALGAAGEAGIVRGARARAHGAQGNGERGLVVQHLSQEQLDALVMGTASRNDEAVRRHLTTCEACARRLMRAAQLEIGSVRRGGGRRRGRGDRASAPRSGTEMAGRPAGCGRAGGRCLRHVVPDLAGEARVRAASGPDDRHAVRGHARPRAPRNLGPGAHELPPQDVCRCVTVELSQGPPTDPGGSQLCTPLSAR